MTPPSSLPLTASRLVGLVAYTLILVPAVIAALQALQIQSITDPATGMLEQIMVAVPNIFAAAIILAIAFVVSRLAATLVSASSAGWGSMDCRRAWGWARPSPVSRRRRSWWGG